MKGLHFSKFQKRLVRFGAWLIVFFCGLSLGAWMLMHQPKFGKLPQGERLERIQKSAHYQDGQFRNLVKTPKFSQDASIFSILWNDLRHPAKRLVPENTLPTVKTDLHALDPLEDLVIWLGHSGYFVQLGGKRILIDPVLSDYAAPFSFMNKAFPGTSIYRPEDMPDIDYLLISHDHWDHLDYPTVMALQEKVGRVVCPLGIDSYFANWGYPADRIRAGNWNDQLVDEDGFSIYLLPARHYSGRLLRQNQTLWGGFGLIGDQRRLFFSGDSGYGPHFADIGRKLGPFDLVVLDSGQYDDRWAYIHMTPEEAVAAAVDLHAEALLPGHFGRFSISRHAWDEPLVRVSAASSGSKFRLLTPLIGEPVMLDDGPQQYTRWWETVGPGTKAQPTDVALLKTNDLLKPDRASR